MNEAGDDVTRSRDHSRALFVINSIRQLGTARSFGDAYGPSEIFFSQVRFVLQAELACFSVYITMDNSLCHRNPKTNVKAKTNPNRNLQKTLKKTWKNVANAQTIRCSRNTVTTELSKQLTLALIFCLLTYIAKQKMQ